MDGDIALIGTGVMGQAILASIVRHTGASRVRVHDVRSDVGQEVAERAGVRWCADVTAAAQDATAVVLAVKPADVPGVLQALPRTPAPLVISVAAGVSTETMAGHLPAGAATVRVMPNTPATIGQGVSVMSPGAYATREHLDLVRDLLAGTGFVTEVAEKHQDVVTAISGSGPAYVFYLIEAMAEAGVLGGLPREVAVDLARRTVAGAGAMAVQSGEHPGRLREQVSSPGGTTMAAISELDERGVRAAVVAAARRAWQRAAELGRAR